jgi:hypothetical protein
MPNPNKADIITVLGQSGSGKSSWVQARLASLPRFILWDTLGEYVGFTVCESRAELYKHITKRSTGLFQVIYNGTDENEEESMDWICQLVEQIENLCFIVEEVDQYASPGVIPAGLRSLLKRGRHRGISMVFVTRRPAEVNRLITAQSKRFVLFRVVEPNDLRYLRTFVGDHALTLPDLPELSFLDWQQGTTTRGRIEFHGNPGVPKIIEEGTEDARL